MNSTYVPQLLLRCAAALLVSIAAASPTHAAVEAMELQPDAVSGRVTVLRPAASASNLRLVVISHGSPGSPAMHMELARALTSAGFTVAMPEHHADNQKDPSDPGPPAWRRRPAEVSRAIDRLSREPALASLDFSRVGMFGMSAGGHTALTLAGGRWSPSRLREHCRVNIADDFHACAGPSLALTGGALDGLKKFVVQVVNDRKFEDANWYGHEDGRIVAVAAGVPFAADFDPDSLRRPRTRLALIRAEGDRWLVPRFHGDAIAAACATCEKLLDLKTGGHGALLGPLPPGRVSELVEDPPGFDRAKEVPRINRAIVDFFLRTLSDARP